MREKTASNDYVIRVLERPSAIEAARWNGLLQAQSDATPFMRHEYLDALHESASAVGATGWLPQFLVVERGSELLAACTLYLKDHSYGEYSDLCTIPTSVQVKAGDVHGERNTAGKRTDSRATPHSVATK